MLWLLFSVKTFVFILHKIIVKHNLYVEWQIQICLNTEANNLRAITENTVCVSGKLLQKYENDFLFCLPWYFHNIIKKNGMYVVGTYVYKAWKTNSRDLMQYLRSYCLPNAGVLEKINHRSLCFCHVFTASLSKCWTWLKRIWNVVMFSISCVGRVLGSGRLYCRRRSKQRVGADSISNWFRRNHGVLPLL